MSSLFLQFAIALITLGLTIERSDARQVRAIFIQPPTDAPEEAVLFNGEKSFEIELPGRNLSPEVTVPGGELTLSLLPQAPAEGQSPPKGAPLVKIPEAWTRCLLLVFPDPKNSVFPIKVLPVDGSAASFPKGNTLIYNVSSATLLAQLGDQKGVAIRPGKTGQIKAPRSGFGSFPYKIYCVLKGDTQKTSLGSGYWQHDPSARQILFVTPPEPGLKVPRVWGVLDRPENTEEARS